MNINTFNRVWMKAGLYEIQQLAGKLPWISSDDLSEDLREQTGNAGMVGALFTSAVNKKMIVRLGLKTSSREPAKGRKVATYRKAFYDGDNKAT